MKKFIYQSKDAKQTKTFDALEWLAAMCSHVPDRKNYRNHLNSTYPTYCTYHLLAKIQYYIE